MSGPRIDPGLMPVLSRLSLVVRRPVDGLPSGNRSGRRRGQSLDFADHRPYADGDDLRFLDWQVLARHDQPFLRRYYEEQTLPVRLLVDTSASMAIGAPDKLAFAVELAAHLGFIALGEGAAVSLHPFADVPGRPLGPLRGRSRLRPLTDRLGELRTGGGSNLVAAARTVTGDRRSGLTVILSDFLIDQNREEGLQRLHHAGHTVALVRVATPDELAPPLGGDVTLVDAETGEELSWSLTRSVLEAYARNRQEFETTLEANARRRGATVARLETSRSMREVILGELIERGVVRG